MDRMGQKERNYRIMDIPNQIKIGDETMDYIGSNPAMKESNCDYCEIPPIIQTPFHLYRRHSDGLGAFVCDPCAQRGKI